MNNAAPEELYLKTNYIFIDTQSYRKAQFDWSGKTLSKIASFVKETELKLLISDVTKREVKKHLINCLDEVNRSTAKQRGIYTQLGLDLSDYSNKKIEYQNKILENFESFLSDTNAIEIETSVDTDKLLDDYFSQTPPFGTKKQSEFPDAIVLSSLEKWCGSYRKVYVVSGDSDFENYCENSSNLIYIKGLKPFIDKALVSSEFSKKLFDFLEENEDLQNDLASFVEDFSVKFMKSHSTSRIIDINGRINEVEYVIIEDVNVTDSDGDILNCYVQFLANINLDVLIEVDGEQYSYDEYDPGYQYQTTYNEEFPFEAELEISYDRGQGEIGDIHSVYVFGEDIEVDSGKLPLG